MFNRNETTWRVFLIIAEYYYYYTDIEADNKINRYQYVDIEYDYGRVPKYLWQISLIDITPVIYGQTNGYHFCTPLQ